MPPVQSLDFQPDGGCTDAMQTAAGACVKKLRDAEWGALLKTALGGPFGWSSVLVVCGVFFYCSVALQPVSHDFALTWWMM